MELNRDEYCDDCWLIVSGGSPENESEKNTKATVVKPDTKTVLTMNDSAPRKKSLEPTFIEEETTSKANEQFIDAAANENRTVTMASRTKLESNLLSPSTVSSTIQNEGRTVTENWTAPENRAVTENRSATVTSSVNEKKAMTLQTNPLTKPTTLTFCNVEEKSIKTQKSTISAATRSKTSSGKTNSRILKSESIILEGIHVNDSDLCLNCLVEEYRGGFETNMLKNVYGSGENSHECKMIVVRKNSHGKLKCVCSDVDCPKFKSWKIIDSGGAGWRVEAFAEGFPPPPVEVGGVSCFATSGGLCSKEQLVELSLVGLTPRIMDEIRPEIEVSEWYTGRWDSSSRYGFKASLLDSRQLMMCVYGECKTLKPPEASRWRRVTYTFRNYEPGVRYVLFHHGGQGQDHRGTGAEAEGHPGSRMAGASVRAILPRSIRSSSSEESIYY